MKQRGIAVLLAWSVLGGACDALGSAEVQPLPPLERPSREARLGLPEVEGDWRFAGWDLPASAPAEARPGLPAPGVLRIATQRLDSLAGTYLSSELPMPVAGEIRRDSIISLAGFDAAGQGRFLAGRVRGDTLWLELTSLPVAAAWPEGARVAFIRGAEGAPFVRVGGVLLRAAADTLPAPGDTAAPAAIPGAAPAAPADTTARAPATPSAGTPRPDTSAAPRRVPPPARRDTVARPQTPPDTAEVDPAEPEPDTAELPPPGPDVDRPPSA